MIMLRNYNILVRSHIQENLICLFKKSSASRWTKTQKQRETKEESGGAGQQG